MVTALYTLMVTALYNGTLYTLNSHCTMYTNDTLYTLNGHCTIRGFGQDHAYTRRLQMVVWQKFPATQSFAMHTHSLANNISVALTHVRQNRTCKHPPIILV